VGLEQEVLALVAVHVAPTDTAGTWSVPRPDDTVVVVRTARQAPRGEAARHLGEQVTSLATMLQKSRPGLQVRVGIATAHEGATGLRVSAEEARTALAAASLSDDAISVSLF